VELALHKAGNKQTGQVTVADDVFAAEYNEALVHQVLTSYLSTGRSASRSLKNRAAVRGGGKKPWRQKGLGRARAGTTRGPLWRGGGVTFPNNERTFARKINKKMYRGALRSIFSELVRQERLLCIDQLIVGETKTKAALQLLAGLGLEEVLIITDTISDELRLATRNLTRVAVINTQEIDPYSLIGFDRVLITAGALAQVEQWLCRSAVDKAPDAAVATPEAEPKGTEVATPEAEPGGADDE